MIGPARRAEPWPTAWFHLADAILVAVTDPHAAPGGSPAFRRARSLAAPPARIPGVSGLLTGFLLRPDRLPFRTEGVSPVGHGSGATVFSLGSIGSGERWVLKVFRRSIGRERDALRRQLAYRRATWARAAGWYAGTGIMLPTHFIILHGPLFRLCAVACLQPELPAPRTDIVHDLTPAELVRTAREDPALHGQIAGFIKGTLRAARDEGMCIDLVGRDNVVLVTTGGRRRLAVLDHGIYRFAEKAARHSQALDQVRRRLDRLAEVGQRLGLDMVSPTAPVGGD